MASRTVAVVTMLANTTGASFLTLPNSDKVNDCKKEFEKVKDWNSLSDFIEIILRGLDSSPSYMNDADARKCLKIKTFVVLKLNNFKAMMDAATWKTRHYCLEDNNRELLEWHMSSAGDYGLLSPWWEKFIKQIQIDCQLDFLHRLESKRVTEKALTSLTTIVNLAQNFNWLDMQHFVREGPSKKLDMRGKGLDDIVDLVETQGRVDEIVRFDRVYDHHIPKQNRNSKLEIELTRDQVADIQKLYKSCSYVIQAKYKLFYPLIRGIRIGYDYSKLGIDERIASYKYIHIWLASIMTCTALDQIKIYEIGTNKDTGMVKIKLRPGLQQIGLDEVSYNLIGDIESGIDNIYVTNDDDKGALNIFTKFRPDLDLVNLDKTSEKKRRNEIKDSALMINNVITSEQFLLKLADFFRSS